MVLPAFFSERHEVKPAAGMESFMEQVGVISKKDGEHLWSLNTKKAAFSEDGKTAGMEGVTLYIPAEGMTVNADSGLYDIENRDLQLRGNVRAVAEDFTIKTESIGIWSDAGELSTDDRVSVESQKFNIEGTGLRAGQRHKVRLLREIKAVFF